MIKREISAATSRRRLRRGVHVQNFDLFSNDDLPRDEIHHAKRSRTVVCSTQRSSDCSDSSMHQMDGFECTLMAIDALRRRPPTKTGTDFSLQATCEWRRRLVVLLHRLCVQLSLPSKDSKPSTSLPCTPHQQINDCITKAFMALTSQSVCSSSTPVPTRIPPSSVRSTVRNSTSAGLFSSTVLTSRPPQQSSGVDRKRNTVSSWDDDVLVQALGLQASLLCILLLLQSFLYPVEDAAALPSDLRAFSLFINYAMQDAGAGETEWLPRCTYALNTDPVLASISSDAITWTKQFMEHCAMAQGKFSCAERPLNARAETLLLSVLSTDDSGQPILSPDLLRSVALCAALYVPLEWLRASVVAEERGWTIAVQDRLGDGDARSDVGVVLQHYLGMLSKNAPEVPKTNPSLAAAAGKRACVKHPDYANPLGLLPETEGILQLCAQLNQESWTSQSTPLVSLTFYAVQQYITACGIMESTTTPTDPLSADFDFYITALCASNAGKVILRLLDSLCTTIVCLGHGGDAALPQYVRTKLFPLLGSTLCEVAKRSPQMSHHLTSENVARRCVDGRDVAAIQQAVWDNFNDMKFIALNLLLNSIATAPNLKHNISGNSIDKVDVRQLATIGRITLRFLFRQFRPDSRGHIAYKSDADLDVTRNTAVFIVNLLEYCASTPSCLIDILEFPSEDIACPATSKAESLMFHLGALYATLCHLSDGLGARMEEEEAKALVLRVRLLLPHVVLVGGRAIVRCPARAVLFWKGFQSGRNPSGCSCFRTADYNAIEVCSPSACGAARAGADTVSDFEHVKCLVARITSDLLQYVTILSGIYRLTAEMLQTVHDVASALVREYAL